MFPKVEWRTLALIVACYGLWWAALNVLPGLGLGLAIAALALLAAMHSSLTHEVLHGHPFASQFWNETLMRLPLGLAVPYCRFRDLHLAHHRDSRLTDPYEDPESNYLDPAVWAAMPRWQQVIFRLNNTLAGRITLGAFLGQLRFMASEWRAWRAGAQEVAVAWAVHMAGVVAVLLIVRAAGVPVWAYLIAAFIALALLRIRTFLEHRAHDRVRSRTVIVEDNGFLAFLFLNNNLHVVHHMHPGLPWYRLPGLYRAGQERFQSINEGYVYRSYKDVFRQYFLKTKDPVAHPLWPQE